MKRFSLFVALYILSLSLYSQNETPAMDTGTVISERALISGYTRGVAYGGGQDYNFATLFGEAGVTGKWVSGKFKMAGEVRFRQGFQFGEKMSVVELREAWAGYHTGNFEVALGNQIVKWGKADGFNPTNVITPTDHFLLTDEPDDQRLSNFMVQAKFRPSEKIVLTLIGIPVFEPSVYRYELFDMGKGTMFLPASKPPQALQHSNWAVKSDFRLGRADLALSWFNGYNPAYGFGIDTVIFTPSPDIRYRPAFYRKQMFGADMAMPVGRSIVRFEAAWSRPEGEVPEMYIPNEGFAYVAGFERQWLGITAILQYVGSYTTDFAPLEKPVLLNPLDPLSQMQFALETIHYESAQFNRKVFFQQEEFNHAVSVSLVRSFAYETLDVNVSTYYNITSEEYLLRGALTWKINDQLKASVGGSLMQGPDGTIFNYAGKVMNGVWLGMSAQMN
jgi:hypothetical protein